MQGVLVILTCLTLLTTVSQSEILFKHPECRTTTNCRRSNRTLTDNKFIYYVNRTMGVNEQQVLVTYDSRDKFFRICCNCRPGDVGLTADDPALPAMKSLTLVKTVQFQGCIVPNVSYASVLADLNITFSSYLKNGVLQLIELPAKPQLEGYHLKGLVIKELLITAAEYDPVTRPKSDFLEHLPELKTLELKEYVKPEKEIINHLPESLVELTLKNTQLTLDGDVWLTRLRSLNFLTIEETEAPPGSVVTIPSLTLLPNLTNLKLYNVPLAPLSDDTTWLKGSKLQNLTLSYCELEELPNGLFEGAEIAKIFLAGNKLKTLNEALAPLQSSLQFLDLSDNMLDGNALVNGVASLKRLETLIVNNNPLNSLCNSEGPLRTNIPSKLPPSLRYLNLQNTGATRICYDWIVNDSLEYLNLDDNQIKSVWYNELQIRREKSEMVTLSLKNNPLRINNITRDHYDICIKESLSKPGEGREYKRVQVKLNLDLSVCDCNAYWLREMMHRCPLLKADDVTCPGTFERISLFDVHKENLTCSVDPHLCPDGCSCDIRPYDNVIVVHCSGALPQTSKWALAVKGYPLALHVPPGTLNHVPNFKLVELHAPYNNITNLDEEDLADTLRVLHLRNNSIEHITFAAAQKLLRLSTTEGYNVTLAGNPLACNCDDDAAIATLQHAKIWDWNTTQCADDQYIIGKKKLCPDIILPALLSVTGALLGLTLIALVLLYQRPRIRQFFFDHNCCLRYWFSFKDDVVDPLKTHDVFISYSYHDHNYAKVLIKRLEDNGHSTIEHCRDWLPGRTISQQITDSVLSARRTLLLVSDNFANSFWGLEEFHAAHTHAMERGSACVIVIRCNLLYPEKLPEELRRYLSNNTYLDWSDHYFWRKLLGVMPTPRTTHQETAISLSDDKMVQPLAGIQLAPREMTISELTHSRVSSDKELRRDRLSELVLVPPVLQLQHKLQQPSGQALPLTPVVREPPQVWENKSSYQLDVQREPVTALRMPAA